jgi:hypothetical protein
MVKLSEYSPTEAGYVRDKDFDHENGDCVILVGENLFKVGSSTYSACSKTSFRARYIVIGSQSTDQPSAKCSAFPAERLVQIRQRQMTLLCCKTALTNSVRYAGPFMHCMAIFHLTGYWTESIMLEDPLKSGHKTTLTLSHVNLIVYSTFSRFPTNIALDHSRPVPKSSLSTIAH